MAYLIDTSVLVRLVNTTDAQHPFAMRAVAELHLRGEVIHVAPQNLIEFRSAVTRPLAVNGLGLTTAEVEFHTTHFENTFLLLDDTPAIFPTWKAVVAAGNVIGKQVHDARLVAICQVHSITHLLTFNVQHFTRLAGFVPNLIVVDPATV